MPFLDKFQVKVIYDYEKIEVFRSELIEYCTDNELCDDPDRAPSDYSNEELLAFISEYDPDEFGREYCIGEEEIVRLEVASDDD